MGDACDPEPDAPRQQLILFDPFTTLDPEWTSPARVQVADDDLILAGAGDSAFVRRPYAQMHDTISIGAETGPGAPDAHLFGVFPEVAGSAPGAAYCELYAVPSGTYLKYTYTLDDAEFISPGTVPAGAIANGSGTLELEIQADTVACRSVWSGVPSETSGARPGGLVLDQLMLYAEDIDVRVAYLVHIRTYD